jgi:hypothetical protein
MKKYFKVGYDISEQFTVNWWEHMYNKSANNIDNTEQKPVSTKFYIISFNIHQIFHVFLTRKIKKKRKMIQKLLITKIFIPVVLDDRYVFDYNINHYKKKFSELSKFVRTIYPRSS